MPKFLTYLPHDFTSENTSKQEKAQIFWAFCCFCVFPAVKSCGEKVRILGILDVSYKEIAHEISKKISRR